MKRLEPPTPLHRWQAGRYINAAAHSTSEAFAARQRERMRAAQPQLAPNVRLFKDWRERQR